MASWLHWSWWASEDRWFHVERPFPWLPIACCAIPVLLIVFAIVLGSVW